MTVIVSVTVKHEQKIRVQTDGFFFEERSKKIV